VPVAARGADLDRVFGATGDEDEDEDMMTAKGEVRPWDEVQNDRETARS
jgi:hypothetical protein